MPSDSTHVENSSKLEDSSKSKSKAVPFFSGFTRKTSAFWKKANYAFDNQFSLSTRPIDGTSFRIKVADKANLTADISANYETKWGTIELEESNKNGPALHIDADNVFHSWNIGASHNLDETEIRASCRPEGSFWNTKLSGQYIPNEDEQHVFRSNASIVVQDAHFNVAVGGEVELENRGDGSRSLQDKNLIKHYSMGFLYSPTNDTEYSLIYTPDRESNGLEYELSLFKQVNDNLGLAACAEGKADFRNTSSSVISMGASWEHNGNFTRGFINSRKEYGVSYETELAPKLELTLGLGSFESRGGNTKTTLGFKFHYSH